MFDAIPPVPVFDRKWDMRLYVLNQRPNSTIPTEWTHFGLSTVYKKVFEDSNTSFVKRAPPPPPPLAPNSQAPEFPDTNKQDMNSAENDKTEKQQKISSSSQKNIYRERTEDVGSSISKK